MKILKKHGPVIVAFAVAMMICGVFTGGQTAAAAEQTYRIDVPGLMWMGQEEESVDVYSASGEMVMLDGLSFTDATIFRVRSEEYRDEFEKVHYDYTIKPAKTGKTVMSVSFTDEEGAPVTLTKELRVKKYPYEIKSLKVNGKKVKITGSKKFEYTVKDKKTSGCVRLTPKKGWKISRVKSTLSVGYGDKFKDYSKNITKKMILKGEKFKFPKKWDDLFIKITLKNGKGETIHYGIHMYR